ncbi:hypothetical protein LTR10_023311 [Elasticomyces elasticus]|uniref:Uncharacterized protein n=1 Tax=Exophiala sideris TaxID=1016849 RepID=A0ABR0JLU3_9EURO|nr:hypothetical protein LTR10_023311 [Elasticomyces elasticus]KAK5036550.1 hypothetical protein LTS07_002277 [Exophiala sideris]KAK5041621.1 hypothetical protein LTR13_002288 [Exophiala sideris]KAK5066933.1 hypothetical protein LTR69_002281 [Exophiala sideris]KAK5184992.1 hypothetical protein LTR44_002838 [Eurotiomycetes sp. CCFEE 6388]
MPYYYPREVAMDSSNHFTLHRRDSSDFSDGAPTYSSSMGHLLFVFFILLLLASLCSIALFFLRRRRLAKKQAVLPAFHQSSHHRSPSVSNFAGLDKNESIFVYDEKMNLIHNSSSPPTSAVPEIHITFPDEDGDSGKIQKGRVVVVHITESGSVGMEPLNQEKLPLYTQEDATRFQSLDLERIGGLKEKDSSAQKWT